MRHYAVTDTRDPFVLAYKDGKAARLAGEPRTANPITHIPAWECEARVLLNRIYCSWDAGWLFGTRGGIHAR